MANLRFQRQPGVRWALLVVTAVALAGCSSKPSQPSPTVAQVHVTGTVTHTWHLPESHCPNPNIVVQPDPRMDGIQVTVKDETGRIIGLATTTFGTCTLNNIRDDSGNLVWITSGKFSVAVPRVAFYQWSVGNGTGAARESYAQLAAAHFVVSLTTGED